MCHLGCTKGVQTKRRVTLFEGAEQLLVVLDAECGVHTALQKELVATEGEHLVGLAEVLLERGYVVAVGLVGLAVEVAEATPRNTDICGIYVAVYLPGHNLGVGNLCGTQRIGLLRQLVQWRLTP